LSGKRTYTRNRPRLKRKRFDHTEKAKKRKEKRKKLTKAEVKKKLLANFAAALNHLQVYNRAPSHEARIHHLREAIRSIELCLETRPGNHMLRAQRAICLEELWELEEKGDRNKGEIEILLDPEWHG